MINNNNLIALFAKVLFVLAIIGFFLPFLSASFLGADDSLTGVETISYLIQEGIGSDEGSTFIFVAVALVGCAVALISSFISSKKGAFVAGISGVIAGVCLVLYRFRLADNEGMFVSVSYGTGWTLSVVTSFLGGLLLLCMQFFKVNKKVETGSSDGSDSTKTYISPEEERLIKRDRMRYIKNSLAANLAILGILFDVLYFVRIYQSDVGTYYYTILIGASIVYNLVFLLAVFLASEGVKNYKPGYTWLLAAIGVGQIIRIFIIPARAHAATTKVGGEAVAVMGDRTFTYVVVLLILSAACLLASAAVNFIRCRELAAHLKTIETQTQSA